MFLDTSPENAKSPPRRVAPPRRIRIHLLGGVRIVFPGGIEVLPRGRKIRALLAYVCFMQGEPVPRQRLIELLWDRSPSTQAQWNFRQALAVLRRALHGARPELIEIGRHDLRLNAQEAWVDIANASERPGKLLDGLDGVTASFDRWLAVERRRFDQRRRVEVEAKLDQWVSDETPARDRAALAALLLELDPAHEPALRHLLTALLELGQRARAILEYKRSEDALHELGLPVSAETAALYNQLIHATLPHSQTSAPRQSVEPPARAPESVGTPTIQAPRRGPLVAVLPFRHLSFDGALADPGGGLAEDLVTMMSGMPDVSVVSRLNTVAEPARDRSASNLRAALGADYALSGSVQMVGDRLCLRAELTDCRSGVALWSWREKCRSSNLFDAQQQVAEGIVRGVIPRIQVGELNRARLRGPEQRDTYDLFLCARSDTHNFSREIFDHAGQLYPEVLARDPQYAEAWAWWAYYFLLRVGQGWSTDPAADVAKADEFARRAVECDPLNPMALAIRGHVAAYLCRDFGTAFPSLDTALEINPYLGFALVCSAAARAYTGRGGRAVEEIERAITLSPHSPLMYAYTSIASLACIASGQAERALEYAWRSVAENPQYTTGLKVLITSLVQVGRTAEAEVAVRQLLALEPSFSVEQFRHFSPTTSSEVGDVFCRSFARAGVPAGG